MLKCVPLPSLLITALRDHTLMTSYKFGTFPTPSIALRGCFTYTFAFSLTQVFTTCMTSFMNAPL